MSLRRGDRVVVPFNVACGFCLNCERGLTNACLTVNPAGYHGGYGYAGMGGFRGGQAEYLRVPFADFNCLKLPGTPGDEHEHDFLLLSDVFPTAPCSRACVPARQWRCSVRDRSGCSPRTARC